MDKVRNPNLLLIAAGLALGFEAPAAAEDSSDTNAISSSAAQSWNWHVQNTDIVQGYPGFSAKYSGPNSLQSGGQVRETISLDLMAGARLWRGAEAHVDGLMWQGFGLSKTLGVEAFPNGEAYKVGTAIPNVNVRRLFLRQTIGLGGEQEAGSARRTGVRRALRRFPCAEDCG